MRVRIDLDQCTRVGDCFLLYRELFREHEDGCPEVRVSPIPEDMREAAEGAARSCPTAAISIEED